MAISPEHLKALENHPYCVGSLQAVINLAVDMLDDRSAASVKKAQDYLREWSGYVDQTSAARTKAVP
jgi:hypothetical protein